MALERYPALFPLPQRDSFAYSVDMGARRTAIATGIPRQRRAYKWQPHYFSLEFIVPISMLWQWQTWCSMKAYSFFEMPVINAATAGEPACTTYSVIRFTSDLTVSALTFENMRVTVSAELAPGQIEA